MMSRRRFAKPFMLTIITIGAAVCLLSAYSLKTEQLDIRFVVLAVATIIASHMTIRMPRINGRVTVSETFIFLIMLLYGGEAAILLAAVEGFTSSLTISRKPITLSFNSAVMACSTFLTVWVLRFLFGPIANLPHNDFTANFIVVVCVMALVQYLTNSILAAVAQAWKTDEPVWNIWSKYCLWTSITYFAGASGAVIIAKLIDTVGFYAVIAATPIILIIYITYRTYLKNIEVMAAAAQAEQAQRHIEELSHYIAEQERIREQFSQIEKMSALGELASGVAHDFNNTLTGILGRAQLLLRTTDPEHIRRSVEIIIKTAEDGAKTVKRIQDFARQRRDHDFMAIAVDQLLLDTSEITRPRWKDRAEAANIHINLELQIHSNALVMGDASELREVLVNMVFNAVDAMPAGGTLTLSAEEVDGYVAISVRDTGVGMNPEVRSRIFDPFFTTKGTAGMGLGLAVSYGIIRRHEGSVEVESEIGKGTTFRIKLPIAKDAVKGQPSGELVTHATPPLQPHQTKILVVDDEDYVRDLLCDILTGEGCQVVMASGGNEALALFEAEKFDAVFTDVGMPGMSGWELARAIRERDAHVPIAVITGWGEAVGSNEQKEAQVDWVVTKPFTIDCITEIAREAARHQDETTKSVAFTVAA